MKLVKFYSRVESELSLNELSDKYKISKKIMEIIFLRGYKTESEIEEFLNPKISMNPFDLLGMDKLTKRLRAAIEKKENIVIFGDYDVDGISATAIMLKTITRLGGRANFYLPNRFRDGYGLTNNVIDKVKKRHNPSLIITVDCGISCFNEVEYAKSLGIEIIITDHHEIPNKIPNTIVVNAKLPGQKYNFDGLCGAGVAYKISEALLGKGAGELLPIAAIATIADIVPLVSENRTIVTRGLALFERYLPPGLKMLFKMYNVPIANVTATEISFKISPKINASGRMGDATDSLLLYLETDPLKLQKLVEKIHKHNTSRQELCNKVYNEAKKALLRQNMSGMRCICLASKAWDHGILGIVCSRLLEEFNRPVFLFSLDAGMLKGSGRSIPNINIHSLLSSMEDILETYGGHIMAAGLSLRRENYDEFVNRVNAFIFEHINDKVFMPISYYDTELDVSEITGKFLSDLERLEPHGYGNLKPHFYTENKNIRLEPMKFFPQHANIRFGGKFSLTFFNFLAKKIKLSFFADQKFIYEVQSKDKGVVLKYESGRNIAPHASEAAGLGVLSQMKYLTSKGRASFKLYPTEKLLTYVTETGVSVFGTCFVAFSLGDYENFVANYDQSGIYNNEFLLSEGGGFNTLILSPLDVEFAQNYKRIVFLSPVVDMSYIVKINEISDAEIFIPFGLKFNPKSLPTLNLGRENFGKIYKALKARADRPFGGFLSFFQSLAKSFTVGDVYLAILVFEELDIIKADKIDGFRILININKKSNLTDSKIYNLVNLFNNIKRINYA